VKEILITLVLIGRLVTTSYRSVPSQTDSTPFYTSTNEHVEVGGAAISRDLLCGACRRLHHRCKRPDNPTKLHYGDWLYIEGFGFRRINDVMGAYSTVRKGRHRIRIPIKNHIDIFVQTYKEEKLVNIRIEKVYKVKIQGAL
jgi:hypothetical protein